MTSVDYDQITDDLNRTWDDSDEHFCHLKTAPSYKDWFCGQGSSPSHATEYWHPGQNDCPGCGRPFCPDCLYLANETWLG